MEIVDTNPENAHVKFPDGRLATISLRHLAPAKADEKNPINDNLLMLNETVDPESQCLEQSIEAPPQTGITQEHPVIPDQLPPILVRRSE